MIFQVKNSSNAKITLFPQKKKTNAENKIIFCLSMSCSNDTVNDIKIIEK